MNEPVPTEPTRSPGPAAPPPCPPDGEQERDVWWGSYSPWTMLPSLLVCFLLTASIAAIDIHLYLAYNLDPDRLRYLAYMAAGVVWAVQTARWVYRIMVLNYRLTTRRLFHARALFYPPREAVRLTDVREVLVEQTRLERLLGVGRIRLLLNDGPALPVVLTGVKAPHRVAGLIETTAARASRGAIRAASPPADRTASPATER